MGPLLFLGGAALVGLIAAAAGSKSASAANNKPGDGGLGDPTLAHDSNGTSAKNGGTNDGTSHTGHPATIVFNPANIKDLNAGRVIAHGIATTPDPVPDRIPADDGSGGGIPGTFLTLQGFASFGSNHLVIEQLQRAAGITVDGIVGPQTQAAYGYFLSH